MAFAIKNCVVILVVWTANLALTCPNSCQCRDDTADCEGCFYETLPGNNVSAVIINMCCAIERLTPTILKLDEIKTYVNVTITNDRGCNAQDFVLMAPNLTTTYLIINNNSIRSIRLVVNGTKLKHLDLSKNKISKLNNNTFHNLTNLINLEIHSNELENLSTNCFFGLTSLQYLDLSNNNLTKLTNIFSPLNNLQHLNLSGNNLEHLTDASFNNGLLQHLDLSHNRLSKVAPGALQFLPNLARLLLADNPALGTTQLLVGTGRRLQQVDVSRTGLLQIPEAFTHSVRFLSLAGNKISAIHCGDLDSYPLLQSLDFTENRLTTIEDDSFGRLEMLLFLNLNNNLLATIPKMLPDELKYLSINNNLIQNLTIPDFNNLPNLRILLLQNNQIAYIQENVFEPLSSLEVLDLSNNPIQILTPSTFNGPVSLRDLRLCYLNTSLPERDVTFPVPSPEGLQMLHLQSSPGLARQLLADSAVLAALSHLQYLDLRTNYLTDVRSDLVFYLSQLRTLRLHGNKINCTSADWLQEWMSWNHTSTNNETCYFSVVNGNEDENRYNCTFSETFTINDSLPPVSLYSTEMINKLLKYYGYLNNKTELSFRGTVNSKTNSAININKENTHNSTTDESANNASNAITKLLPFNSSSPHDPLISNEIDHSQETKLSHKTRSTNDIFTVKNSRFKTTNPNFKTHEENNEDRRILESRMSSTLNLHENQNKQQIDVSENTKYTKIKTGKTVNKPINRSYTEYTTSTKTSKTTHKMNDAETSQMVKISALTLLKSPNGTDVSEIVTIIQEKTESSPFQASSHSYASYVGVFAVTSLLAVCLVLWASLRLRYRQRRRRTSLEQENEDHIEVASISGGVLW